MKLLAFETATEACSVALWIDGAVIERFEIAPRRHAEVALPWAGQLLQEAGIARSELDAIAVGRGPGAFTGVRLAIALAQGIAMALDKPVVAVSTLAALSMQSAGERTLAAIDARMGEVYHAAYLQDINRRNGDPWRVVHAPGLCRPQDVPVPEGGAWTGLGSGFAAHGEVLRGRLAGALDRFEPAVVPTAAAVLRLARPRFGRGEGGAPEAAIPIYLRDKVALTASER
jgi:tRNA threonylcarbamoyladenosine biosynthesis protein TsaB